MDYFAITTRGLEQFARDEIEQKLSNSKIKNTSYRKVVFSFDGGYSKLLTLRSVEDVFYFLGEIENVGHSKDSLDDLTDRICELDFNRAVDVISKVRETDINEFSVSSSSVGKRNYSYVEVKESLSTKLQGILGFKHEDEKHEMFDIRVFIEHDRALIGARLASKPLHRRSYKTETTKATLQADVAYAMSLLAEIKPDDVVLDPMCGSGTILIESSTFGPKSILGGDIQDEAVKATNNNIKAFNSSLNIEIKKWDATHLPLEDKSIDKIICNLPFGKQIEVESVANFYKETLKELSRVTKNEEKLVLLTSNYEKLIDALSQNKLELQSKHEISLNGEIVYICVAVKEL